VIGVSSSAALTVVPLLFMPMTLGIRPVCHLSNVVLSQVVKDGMERPDLVSSSTTWRVKVRSISQIASEGDATAAGA
jgi:hypothetical protein